MSKAKKRQKQQKEKYQLNINESLMYAIQSVTQKSTYEIASYFYKVLVKQKKEILLSHEEYAAAAPGRYYKLIQKKSYGFYPGTQIYFVAVTNQKKIDEEEDNGIFGTKIVDSYFQWECNVSVPRTMLEFDNEKINNMLAEGILIEGGAEPDVDSPHTRKDRHKNSIEKLGEDSTESRED